MTSAIQFSQKFIDLYGISFVQSDDSTVYCYRIATTAMAQYFCHKQQADDVLLFVKCSVVLYMLFG